MWCSLDSNPLVSMSLTYALILKTAHTHLMTSIK